VPLSMLVSEVAIVDVSKDGSDGELNGLRMRRELVREGVVFYVLGSNCRGLGKEKGWEEGGKKKVSSSFELVFVSSNVANYWIAYL